MSKYVISYNPYQGKTEVKKGEDRFPDNSDICVGLNKDRIYEWFDESASWPGLGKVLEDDNNASKCEIVFNGRKKDFKVLNDYFQKYKGDTDFLITQGILLDKDDDTILDRLKNLCVEAKRKRLLSNKEISIFEDIVKRLMKRQKSVSPVVFSESVNEIIEKTNIEGKIVQLCENIGQSDSEIAGLKERIYSAEDRKKEDFENDLEELEITAKIKKKIDVQVNRVKAEPIYEARKLINERKRVDGHINYDKARTIVNEFLGEVKSLEDCIDEEIGKVLNVDIYSKEKIIYNQYTSYITENGIQNMEGLQLGKINRIKHFNMNHVVQRVERKKRKEELYFFEMDYTIAGDPCEVYFGNLEYFSEEKRKLQDETEKFFGFTRTKKVNRGTGEFRYNIKADDLINEIEQIYEIENQNVEELLKSMTKGCRQFAESIRNNIDKINYYTSNEKTVLDIREKEKEKESKEKQLRVLESFLDSLKKVTEIC